MLLFRYAILALATLGAVSQKCCEGDCAAEGTAKYYSIAKTPLGGTNCGECCMYPEDYDLYLKFEPNLLPANNTNPCFEFGFPLYLKTEVHGFGSVKMTLDMYTPEN